MNVTLDQETVRTVVLAYGAGRIELEKPDARGGEARNAPSFLTNSSSSKPGRPYTAQTVAKFLGWDGKKDEKPPAKAREARDAPGFVLNSSSAQMHRRASYRTRVR